jgi:hypothetical protein
MLILCNGSKMSSINFRKIIISGKICKTGNKITVCADKEVEMKKEAVFMKRLFAAILCLCLLAGCGGKDSTGDTCGTKDDPAAGTEKVEPAGETFRIIQEQPENLLLAKTDGNSADVYTLSLRDAELTLDGNAFDRNEPGAYQSFPDGTLTGALVEVACDLVLETYPGQLAEVTAVNIRSDGFDDRCALYLRVLNDLWAVDEGLNSDITMLSVDLSQTGLSDSEQAAVAWVFGGMHDISETMTMSYEELAAEGYLTGTEPDSDGIPCWEDGCLFTITEQNGQDSIHVEQDSKNITGADPLPRTEEKSGAACQLPPAEAGQGQSDFCPVKTKSGEPDALQNTVTFDAQKWRSALGAYFFTDCTASRDAQGHWGDYTVGAAAIS